MTTVSPGKTPHIPTSGSILGLPADQIKRSGELAHTPDGVRAVWVVVAHEVREVSDLEAEGSRLNKLRHGARSSLSRFPHRVAFVRRFPRRAFFVGAPIYAYGGGCAWLRYRALVTGSPYWWRRYRWCLGW